MPDLQSPTILDVFNSFHPLATLLIAGAVGGLTAIIYDLYNGHLSWRLLLQLPLGVIAGTVAGIIEAVPGNAGLFLTGLIAGIGGVSLISQYVGLTEGKKVVFKAVQEQAESVNQQVRIGETLDMMYGIIQKHPTNPTETIQELAQVFTRMT